ncbi:DDE-type integrase/transposase/recombinase [Streptomyces sp. NPDC127091]|uniref:DDE-type integrase/transposase/recombinase n=1 Tax=Streptomyces sp. NPDC127091 TaxID=3347134 RepID=UPI003669EF11
MDEVFIKIDGERKYLWRAVDRDGNVLDILVRPRRDLKAHCGSFAGSEGSGVRAAGDGDRQAPLL